MVDTARTQAALLALFANNTDGDISPQDLRDFVVSCFGVLGGIYVDAGSTAQTGITTSPTKLTGFAANAPALGVTPDHTDDSIALPTPGYYIGWCSLSFTGTNGALWTIELAVDGVGAGFGLQRGLGTPARYGNAGFPFLVQTTVGGEKLSLLINSDIGGGASFTPSFAQLFTAKFA